MLASCDSCDVEVFKWASLEAACRVSEKVAMAGATPDEFKDALVNSADDTTFFARLVTPSDDADETINDVRLCVSNEKALAIVRSSFGSVWSFDLGDLVQGETRHPMWTIDEDSKVSVHEWRCWDIDDTGKHLVACYRKEESPEIFRIACLRLSDASIVKKHSLGECSEPKAVAWSPCGTHVAVGYVDGGVELIRFNADKRTFEKLASHIQIPEIDNGDDQSDGGDGQAEHVSRIFWYTKGSLLVGYAGAIDPRLVAYDGVDLTAKDPLASISAWNFTNPLGYNEEYDKPWDHTFFVRYFSAWKAYIVGSSSSNLALLGPESAEGSSEWKRWSVMDKNGDVAIMASATEESSVRGLSERPWLEFELDGEEAILEKTRAFVGMELIRCTVDDIRTGVHPWERYRARRQASVRTSSCGAPLHIRWTL